ncbi:hypothetical protein [Salimicrobium halophilum]|nr:hypothetical protein [Salimicrobium halophilum]
MTMNFLIFSISIRRRKELKDQPGYCRSAYDAHLDRKTIQL